MSDCSAEISMRNPRACGSLAQHSGLFVFMLFWGLMVTTTRQLQTTKCLGGTLSKTEKTSVQPIPKADATARNETGREFQGQRSVTGARDILAELLLVRCENADTAPAARDADIPLLRVRGGLNRRVGEQNVIHGLALRTVGRDGIAQQKLTVTGIQHTAIRQPDS